MQTKAVLIGIDGGGTHCRAMCASVDGTVLAVAEGAGTNPDYNSAAADNFRSLVHDLLASAGRDSQNIAGLAAGLAGLDEPDDAEWALQMTSLPGMPCKPVFVNDSVVAQVGAFGLGPGILVVLGTGAITVGIAESGEIIRNYDFNHYARSSARFLAHDAVYRLLTEDLEPADGPFLRAVLNFWQAETLDGLRDIAKTYAASDRESTVRRYGQMAPLLTEAASAGSPLARRVCDFGASGTALGVRLVATCFGSADVPVVLHGSVALCPYMKEAIRSALSEPSAKRYRLADPLLSPMAGAILLAAREGGNLNMGAVRDNLLKSANIVPRP